MHAEELEAFLPLHCGEVDLVDLFVVIWFEAYEDVIGNSPDKP